MEEIRYKVWEGEELIAQDMTMETVLILVKGLYHEYWDEESLKISIQRIHYSQSRERYLFTKEEIIQILYESIVNPEVDEADEALVNFRTAVDKIRQMKG